ncbi:DUF742 domain-containing protein [Saccharomonospora saliphila]|uniref:DUF742 domain-containing protein n=1 Tax=Saccharomonospora saliphila TaxID=369829 RepID=UPI0003709873|nr:DUF742 domain-containing protein [Saccharomonospora saliphila]
MSTSDDDLGRRDERTGARFRDVPGALPKPERIVMSPHTPPGDADDGDDGGDDGERHRLRARPYVLTKGRTRARDDLAIETLVSTEPTAPWHRNLGSEYQAVRRLCTQPKSVAEVAANLAVPLGVARVLISDLADTGFVRVHTVRPSASGRPDADLMHRVLAGLQRL